MMMSTPISEIFARTDIEQVMAFILYGAENSSISTESYNTRINKATRPIVNRLNEIYANADDKDNAQSDLSQALAIYQNVYMEIGMKAGAKLLYQLLFSDKGGAKVEQ